jgi:hypothetical protein
LYRRDAENAEETGSETLEEKIESFDLYNSQGLPSAQSLSQALLCGLRFFFRQHAGRANLT